MGLEATTTIQGLNIANPTPSDARSEGDDHIRLLKNVLKTTFAGPAGTGFSVPITAKEADLNQIFTTGVKACFHQAAAPIGWVQDVTPTYASRMMRIVNTAGGGVGGTHDPIANTVIPDHSHAQQGTFGTGGMNVNATHTHSIPQLFTYNGQGGGATSDAVRQVGFTLSGITNIDHAHQLTISGQTSNVNAGAGESNAIGTYRPLYMDMILCTKS
jgi:hypothetical protein